MTSREFRDRLARRAEKGAVALTATTIEQLEAYYRLLARWNTKINLTALSLQELNDQAIDRLLVEPLAAARFVADSPLIWFDLGSGGGSPAIPLKIVRPAARLTMVESKARKAAFLMEAVRTLGMSHASVAHARFEEVAAKPEVQQQADLVTVRAVKADQVLFGVARSLLRETACLLMFRSDAVRPTPAQGFDVRQVARLSDGANPAHLVVCKRR